MTPTFEVLTREVPEQKVVSLLQRLHVTELPGFLEGADGELRAHLRAAGLPVTGETFVVYHGDVNVVADGPVEVCVPFEGSLEPRGRVRVRLEPRHHEAYVRLAPSEVVFPDVLAAYEAVRTWLDARGLALTDSPREVYHRPLSEGEPTGCDVAWPYEPAHGAD